MGTGYGSHPLHVRPDSCKHCGMQQNSAVLPYRHDGGTTGVLLCHGFTGSPASMRPWGEFLARHGYSVRVPLLPGHGTRWQDMNRTTWTDWYGTQAAALAELRDTCERVFVFGLSMGGTLALRLAQTHPDIAGLVLVNASVHTTDPRAKFAKILQYVLPSLPGVGNDIKKPGMDEHCYDRLPVRAFVQLQALWQVVSADITKVSQPVLVFSSAEDHVVESTNARWVVDNISSTEKSHITLYDSYHVATLDYDADTIFQQSLLFLSRHG